VLRDLAQRVLVLHLGKVMEQASAAELLETPRHPCTRMLIAERGNMTGSQPGEVIEETPSGCVFRVRCPMADELCAREVPHLRRVGPTAHAACHYVEGTQDGTGPDYDKAHTGPWARRLATS
jgi:oligopeptide/dipeptide ABC transporter ATP-binding protein